jgi:hypothetical protein
MSSTNIWKPGKRVLTDIHRARAGSKFKVCCFNPTWAGWSVVWLAGDRRSRICSPEEAPEELLSFLGHLISSALQRFILVGNLQTENLYTQELLAIRNCLMENTSSKVFWWYSQI